MFDSPFRQLFFGGGGAGSETTDSRGAGIGGASGSSAGAGYLGCLAEMGAGSGIGVTASGSARFCHGNRSESYWLGEAGRPRLVQLASATARTNRSVTIFIARTPLALLS